MWARKRFDITWATLLVGVVRCFLPQNRPSLQRRIELHWAGSDALVCFSVRSGFDLLLTALELPRGSEILVSAVTVRDMARIIAEHGLTAVPIDLDTGAMAVNPDWLQRAVTPATRAVMAAHLFGNRTPMQPIIDFARRHGLLVIEDCAQAFDGGRYDGCPDSDAVLFSFGPIKTSTALGGAVLLVRNGELRERMRRVQAGYPVQSRRAYLQRLLKYAALKAISARPMFALAVRLCQAAGCDYDAVLNNSARGFSEAAGLSRFRQQPSTSLLCVLERQLQRFDRRQLQERSQRGAALRRLLHEQVICPGAEASFHSYWVFPIQTNHPERIVERLRKGGYDATRLHRLVVVDPPQDRPELDPQNARCVLSQTVFLPVYPEMPPRELERMSGLLLSDVQLVSSSTAVS